jgi:hypothetical protein
MKLHWMLNALPRTLTPGIVADGSGGGGGDADDRGDDFVPTDDDAGTDDTKPGPKATGDTEAGEEKPPKEPKEPDTEGEADDEHEEERKPAKKDTRIPISRHEALLKKEREARQALEARLSQYEKGSQIADLNADLTKTEEKVVELEKSYAKLVADGEVEKAAAVMREIRQLDRQMTEAKADMKIAAAVAQATESARYNIALERIEAAYPKLNPDHDDFDNELLTDVADLKTTYERRGMTPTQALQKAVAKLLPSETGKQEDATTVKPRVDPKDVAAERKKAAVDKLASALKATPPDTSKVGQNSDALGGGLTAKDVMKMSNKDFNALSEESLSRMRGDEL